MKIIKQNYDDITPAELKRKKANEGCDVCPNCHKKKYICETPYEMTLKIGKRKAKRVDRYECNKCGCRWQSDPF